MGPTSSQIQSWCLNETECTVFWLRRKIFFLIFVFRLIIKTHYSVFHCHVKGIKIQEPVDISHFLVSTFQHFSPSAPAKSHHCIYCVSLVSTRAQLYNQLCRLKSCRSTKHTCSTLAV